MQPGDVKVTISDCNRIKKWINFSPQTPIEFGVEKFSSWFKNYYELNN